MNGNDSATSLLSFLVDRLEVGVFVVDSDMRVVLWNHFMASHSGLAAEEVIAKVNASKRWPDPVMTTLEPLRAFTPAEEEHQDYLQKHPGGYTCHFVRD